jgi:16S rRNA A1518/A1519 N6-dimethyltransferase RsmA/KsgA/DIM1 with predicted DNA glycosylase/AP lyase activity
VAFEIDKNFFGKLSQKFLNEKSLVLKPENFLESNLPSYPYKVFSNIPTSIKNMYIDKKP